jgi:hypothetical protein
MTQTTDIYFLTVMEAKKTKSNWQQVLHVVRVTFLFILVIGGLFSLGPHRAITMCMCIPAVYSSSYE